MTNSQPKDGTGQGASKDGRRIYTERQLAEARRYTDADYEEVKRNLYPPRTRKPDPQP